MPLAILVHSTTINEGHSCCYGTLRRLLKATRSSPCGVLPFWPLITLNTTDQIHSWDIFFVRLCDMNPHVSAPFPQSDLCWPLLQTLVLSPFIYSLTMFIKALVWEPLPFFSSLFWDVPPFLCFELQVVWKRYSLDLAKAERKLVLLIFGMFSMPLAGPGASVHPYNNSTKEVCHYPLSFWTVVPFVWNYFLPPSSHFLSFHFFSTQVNYHFL